MPRRRRATEALLAIQPAFPPLRLEAETSVVMWVNRDGAASPLRSARQSDGVSPYQTHEMALEINANQAALVGTSVTAWPGWKLAVDGAAAALVLYNHAFLEFRVSAGRHTAMLRYRRDGFVCGSAVSAATLLFCAVLFVRSGGPRCG